jgi:NAD(P)-dependent dehydrogenase (short-subunit alcohol dehydrogenase family)
MTDRGVAIVTGGASGIGFAIAEALLADSWKPILDNLTLSLLETACARLDAPRANATKNASSWRSPTEARASQAWAAARTVWSHIPDITGPVNAPLVQTSTSRRTRNAVGGPVFLPTTVRRALLSDIFPTPTAGLRCGRDIGWNRAKRSDYIEQEQQDLSLSSWNICI